MSVERLDLAGFRVVLANAQKKSGDDGSTLDLSDQHIGELPIEILELMKADVTR
jgi:hypothetical protein